jgi:hypothetical protein
MNEYWQIQELDGTSISDHSTEDQAKRIAKILSVRYQRAYRVVRIAHVSAE